MLISRIGSLCALIAATTLLPSLARALVIAESLPISSINDIEVADGLAYVVRNSTPEGSPSLLILDLSDPAHPVEVGSLYTPGGARRVEVVGGRVYITERRSPGGVRIIDVSDPTRPVEIGAVPTQCFAADLGVVGNYVYVADQITNSRIPECGRDFDSRLRVFDVSNPSAPIQLSESEIPWPVVIEAVEGFVYAASARSHSENLEVIDVSDPTAPITVGTVSGVWAYDLEAADGYVYAASSAYDASTGEAYGLEILDVMDPTDPLSVGRVGALGYAIDVVDGVAFLAGLGLQVVDVSDPRAPARRGSLFVVSTPRALAVYGGHAYIAGGGGLNIVDVSLLDTPTEVGWAEVEGSAGDVEVPNDVEIAGGVAYLAVGEDRFFDPAPGEGGLRTYDISDPTAPAPLGGIDTNDNALDVELAGRFAFVAAETDGLRVFDVANPSAPVAAGALALPGSTARLVLVGTTAYVMDRGITREAPRALRVIDVSNPAAPAQRGAVEFADSRLTRACEIPGIAVAREIAYVVCNGFYVIDVSDPARPTLISGDPAPPFFGRSSIAVTGDRMYVSEDGRPLSVYDISDPTQPVEIFETPGGNREIAVEDGLAYSAGAGLSVHDLAGPQPAALLGGYPATRNSWNGLAVADGLIFGVTRDGALQVVDLGPEYPRVRSVEIAIRAERESAVVNLASRGLIRVAIFGAADLDVALIERSTLRFGPSSAAPVHMTGGHFADVNGDAKPDLISHYRIADTGLSEADEQACVSGRTADGTPIRGCGALVAMLPRGQANAASVSHP